MQVGNIFDVYSSTCAAYLTLFLKVYIDIGMNVRAVNSCVCKIVCMDVEVCACLFLCKSLPIGKYLYWLLIVMNIGQLFFSFFYPIFLASFSSCPKFRGNLQYNEMFNKNEV